MKRELHHNIFQLMLFQFQFTCLRDITQEGSYYLKIESLPLPNPEYTKMKDMFVAFNEVGKVQFTVLMLYYSIR